MVVDRLFDLLECVWNADSQDGSANDDDPIHVILSHPFITDLFLINDGSHFVKSVNKNVARIIGQISPEKVGKIRPCFAKFIHRLHSVVDADLLKSVMKFVDNDTLVALSKQTPTKKTLHVHITILSHLLESGDEMFLFPSIRCLFDETDDSRVVQFLSKLLDKFPVYAQLVDRKMLKYLLRPVTSERIELAALVARYNTEVRAKLAQRFDRISVSAVLCPRA